MSSASAQHLVESRGLARLVVALGEVRRVLRGVRVETGGELEVAVLLVEMRRDRLAARDALVDLGECGQPRGRAVGLADRDGTVESHDRSVGEPEQLVVP